MGFEFEVERYSGLLNRILLNKTFAESPHPYIRFKYDVHMQNLRNAAASNVTFYDR